MTREEAIKIINCYDIGFCDLSGEKIPADKLVDAFDMAIEALQAEPKTGEWIPCSERLPNEDECGWYLVTVKGHELFVDVAPFNDKLWKGLYSNQEVLAWKPLPMPYREESEV